MKKLALNLSEFRQYKTLIIVLAVVILFLLIICLTLWLPHLIGGNGGGDSDTADSGDWQPSTCEELLGKAMDASYRGCQTIGSNQICYGNFDVNAQLAAESVARFASLGDTIPINQLVTLSTAPMDLSQNIWGIAVFKLQANLPGTIPGQNVTFLVFGDTGLYNFSGDMYSIYFSTGIGSVTCSQVPDGLMVDVPNGSGIVFNANGVELELAGDSVLAANPGENMRVTMLNGSGVVTADGKSQEISGGQFLTIPIGDDLEAGGPPSDPIELSSDMAMELCLLTGENCNPDEPFSWLLTQTADNGEIETITKTPAESGQATSTLLGSTPTFTPTTTPRTEVTKTPTPSDSPASTDTPIPATCGDIRLSNDSPAGDTISLEITNDNASPVVIDRIQLSWVEDVSGQLDEIRTTKILWGQGGTDASSPADITFLADRPHRTIDGNEARIISFIFMNDPAIPLESLTVHFDIGCSKSR